MNERKEDFGRDRVEGDTIILHNSGRFPKNILFVIDEKRKTVYRLVKTRSVKLQLNK